MAVVPNGWSSSTSVVDARDNGSWTMVSIVAIVATVATVADWSRFSFFTITVLISRLMQLEVVMMAR